MITDNPVSGELLYGGNFTGNRAAKVSCVSISERTPGREAIGATECLRETPNDFLEVLPSSTECRSDQESFENHAATGV